MHQYPRHIQSAVASRPGVLLIEAGPSSTLEAALDRAGFVVAAARGGVDAITDATAGRDVTAIVLDGADNAMHGLDLVSYLRYRFPAAPLVFLGGYGGDMDKEPSFGRGAIICLRRPVGTGVIVAAVASAVLRTAVEQAFSPPRREARRLRLLVRDPEPARGRRPSRLAG
jgi:DNA-binding response OmpR family regulator